jgi:hypothetical protein
MEEKKKRYQELIEKKKSKRNKLESVIEDVDEKGNRLPCWGEDFIVDDQGNGDYVDEDYDYERDKRLKIERKQKELLGEIIEVPSEDEEEESQEVVPQPKNTTRIYSAFHRSRSQHSASFVASLESKYQHTTELPLDSQQDSEPIQEIVHIPITPRTRSMSPVLDTKEEGRMVSCFVV